METLFEKYIQGKCTNKDYENIRTFINNPANDALLDELMYENWIQSSNSEPTIKPNTELLDSIHHQIALKENKTAPVVRIYRTWLAVAAVLIIGLITSTLILLVGTKDEIINRHISTPYGAKTQFILPDGSEVWLNSGSTLTFPDQFRGERIVELSGEAYFSVEKKNQPFKVRTHTGDVKVLGTEFDVKAYDGEIFNVTLENGVVSFICNTGQEVKLEPGMQIVCDSKNIKIRNVETRLFTSWKDGQLIFRDEPLQNIITQLERWYNVKIELLDDGIKNLRYTGTIEMESFSEVLELIKVTTPINYSFDRKTRILTISASKN